MSLEEIRQTRLKKIDKINSAFGKTFPIEVSRDFSVAEVVDGFSRLSRRRKSMNLVGRVFGIRGHGGIIFCDFKDGSLDKENKMASMQAYIKKDIIEDEKFSLFEETVDVGDFVEFTGSLFKTQKGEKSLKITSFRFVAKSLRPLPEKWHGLSDVEERFRKRYLDLLMNDEARSIFLLRSKLITEIRTFLNRHNFLEVETPILQPLAGGAIAEPFKTHHHALDIDLFLRIAPELYLKRLLVGGFENVYEIGRNFRNEGIDATHSPEFTMLEFYSAYQDAEYLRSFLESLFRNLVKKLFNKQVVEHEGHQISFSKKFNVISFYDVLKRHALMNDVENASRGDFELKAQQFGIEVLKSDSREKIADNIFKKLCKPKIIQPTFIVDLPIEISPLAKKKDEHPNLTDRLQLIIGGLELANGFSELNDPLDQKERFDKQLEKRKAGDKEAFEFDDSFLEAMEYGMPPAAGVGIGIDRLAMFFSNTHNMKEVILFPTLRPKGNA